MLTFKTKLHRQLVYLFDILQNYTPTRQLRSSSAGLLKRQTISTKTSDRAFSAATVKIWNDLPVTVRSATSSEQFARRLKTHLFALSWLMTTHTPEPLTQCCIAWIMAPLTNDWLITICYIYRSLQTWVLKLTILQLSTKFSDKWISTNPKLYRSHCCQSPRFLHITPVLKSLHWLKVKERIEYNSLSISHL